MNDNTWYYVVDTFAPLSCTMNVYVDGLLQASQSTGKNTIQATDQPVTIGRSCFSDGFFVGKLDNVQLYNTALSSSQVSSLYVSGSTSPNVTWVTSSGSFETAANWQDANSNQRVPVSTDNLFFTSPRTYAVSLSSPHTVQAATVSAGNVTLSGSSLTVSSGLSINGGAFFSTGGTSIGAGTLNSAGTFTHSGPGTIAISGSATNSGTMNLAGNVTVGGTFTNSGVLTQSGITSAQTFTQNSSGVLNYQISGSGTGKIVAGQANLGGSLKVTLGNGFVPTSGSSYQILSTGFLSTGASITGDDITGVRLHNST